MLPSYPAFHPPNRKENQSAPAGPRQLPQLPNYPLAGCGTAAVWCEVERSQKGEIHPFYVLVAWVAS